MVKIENITRQEEERKLKIKKIKDLLSEFFDNVDITTTSTIVSMSSKDKYNHFLFVNPSSDEIVLSISESVIPQYTDKTMAFAKEYEKLAGREVTLKTDYSK